VPQVSLPKLKWPSFKSDTIGVAADSRINRREVVRPKSETTFPQIVEPAEKIVKVVDVTPRLKPSLTPLKKSKVRDVSDAEVFNEMAQKTDRLQDRMRPAGRSIKTSVSDKIPGKGLIELGDRTISVYGLILIMAFGLVLLLMSLAKPTSRLGGRH